jgi:hypothetical protein
MTHIDLTIQSSTIVEVKAPVLFHCLFCGRPITQRNRLSYPVAAQHQHAPVYRCRCGMIIGELVAVLRGEGAE